MLADPLVFTNNRFNCKLPKVKFPISDACIKSWSPVNSDILASLEPETSSPAMLLTEIVERTVWLGASDTPGLTNMRSSPACTSLMMYGNRFSSAAIFRLSGLFAWPWVISATPPASMRILLKPFTVRCSSFKTPDPITRSVMILLPVNSSHPDNDGKRACRWSRSTLIANQSRLAATSPPNNAPTSGKRLPIIRSNPAATNSTGHSPIKPPILSKMGFSNAGSPNQT